MRNNVNVPIKLNNKIKKAVVMGDGYEDFETLMQYQTVLINEVEYRIDKLEKRIEFLYGKVSIVQEGDSTIVTCSKARNEDDQTEDNTFIMILHHDKKGKVEFVTKNLCKDDELRSNIDQLMWAAAILPLYYKFFNELVAQRKDIKNSEAIRSLAGLSRDIRQDLFTTVGCVSHFNILDSDDETDPYGIFAEEG